jgi:hypothetical protein
MDLARRTYWHGHGGKPGWFGCLLGFQRCYESVALTMR